MSLLAPTPTSELAGSRRASEFYALKHRLMVSAWRDVCLCFFFPRLFDFLTVYCSVTGDTLIAEYDEQVPPYVDCYFKANQPEGTDIINTDGPLRPSPAPTPVAFIQDGKRQELPPSNLDVG